MRKVLIVDDSPSQVHVLKKLVEDWGYETLTAESGVQAMQIARREQPDVILMDVVMSDMSGFQAARKLSRDQVTHAIPVIFVSIKDSEADKLWGMRQGATGYVTKPVDPQKLLTAITEAVSPH
jgi:twitching motility two-component system response regulator PilH